MRKLRLRKAAGPDGVIGEHLKWGGNVVQEWLLRVTNAVVDLEVVPSVLKSGVIVSVSCENRAPSFWGPMGP